MSIQHEIKEIKLRDVESVLRQTLGDKLIVERFTTKSLLPPGENYGSTILSVDAVIKRNGAADSKSEDLHLIAKMSPPTEYQKRIFDSPYTFKKEAFMYEEIIPSYNKLEIEFGIKPDEVFDILPKFYGWRLSSSPDVDFDDDAVILLENLKVRGYYTGNRSQGYDLDHSKLAVRAMARFHGLGMAMKQNKPECFANIKFRAKSVEFKGDDFKDLTGMLLDAIRENPDTSPYYDRCDKAITGVSPEAIWAAVPSEPWSTIVHSDFWVNNIMFHRTKDGQVDDVKFVDFQNYLFFSPLRELLFYIFSSGDGNVRENHVDQLIELYYEALIDVTTRMGCDTELLGKQSFYERISNDAPLEFMHLAFMLKMLTLDVKETNFNYDKVQTVMIDYKGNDAFTNRLRDLVLIFVHRNWI